jgi:CTP synthase
MAERIDGISEDIHIAVVGKYTGLVDSYLSVIKALQHASFEVGRKLVIDWIEATDLEKSNDNSAWKSLRSADGVLVPGGFGDRGIEGKILAANYARTTNKPYLGVCLGLQVAVVEFCRNVLGWEGANSTEFDEQTPHPVVVFMPEISKSHLGGTMRLGSRPTIFQVENSHIRTLYGDSLHVDERHRHRYEVNPDCVDAIESKGLKFVGKDETGQRCEIFELEDHPYFVGTQYHPEFKTRPNRPSPPFLGLLEAAAKQ